MLVGQSGGRLSKCRKDRASGALTDYAAKHEHEQPYQREHKAIECRDANATVADRHGMGVGCSDRRGGVCDYP